MRFCIEIRITVMLRAKNVVTETKHGTASIYFLLRYIRVLDLFF